MLMFKYVLESDLGQIFGESESSGLVPGTTVVGEFSYSGENPRAFQPAIFGLFEQEPETWRKFDDNEDVLGELLWWMAKGDPEARFALLRVQLEESDQPWVYDWSPMQRYAQWGGVTGPTMLPSYLGSRVKSGVPISEYHGSYDLPEIVIFSRIPNERIDTIGLRVLTDICPEDPAKKREVREFTF
ncbi:hypothetical protein ACFL2V_18820 [Pseudomonadota bacterium]